MSFVGGGAFVRSGEGRSGLFAGPVLCGIVLAVTRVGVLVNQEAVSQEICRICLSGFLHVF